MAWMPKPSAPKYRTTNWSEYSAGLRRRGSPEIWFDPGRRCSALLVELDPCGFSWRWAETFARHHVSRASLGVQTFAPHIQRAIGRVQPVEEIACTGGAAALPLWATLAPRPGRGAY
jgi:hypothetical protein